MLEVLKWIGIGVGGFWLLCIIGVAILLVRALLSPGFDSTGHINECIGCPYGLTDAKGETNACTSCEFNPDYWDGYKYIGPSKKELKRIRREGR